MNKARRKSLGELQDRIAELGISQMRDKVQEILDKLEEIREEEQDALDNLPEGLRDGERGQDMQAAVDSMGEAFDALETLAEALDEAEPDTLVGHIDDAKGTE